MAKEMMLMKPRSTIGQCPVCEGSLRVTELSCPACRTRIVSDLKTCEFCNLSPGLLTFLRSFLRARGNIKEVERELGISYPTVRKRLDDLLGKLALESGGGSDRDHRLDTFERLRKGEISVDDAVDSLGGPKEG
jgi:hypothetical protein